MLVQTQERVDHVILRSLFSRDGHSAIGGNFLECLVPCVLV